MARDDRHDPHRPAPPSPRDLRASLSSSIGLARPGGGPADRGSRAPADDDLDGVAAPGEVEADGGLDPDRGHETMPRGEAPPVRGPTAPALEPDRDDDVAVAPPARRGRAPRGKAAGAGAKRSGSGRAKSKPRAGDDGDTSGRTIVPPQAVAGRALVLVVAIMGFLACLAVGTLSLVSEAARDWQLDVSREVTIQVKPIDGVAMEGRLQKAMEIARATRGVRSARLIDAREGEILLEPWLGSGLDLSALPIPRLVVIALDDPATADVAGLKKRIGAEVAGALLDDHAVWAGRLRTMAGTMVVVGVAVVLLMLTAMVLSVVFATRAAMAGNRDVIEVLHFVGAEDRFIAREFQRHFLVLGLEGGSIGGAAAILGFLVADFATRSPGDAFSDQAHALFGGFSVGWSGYFGVLAVVGLVAILTAVTSRITVLGHLGRLD